MTKTLTFLGIVLLIVVIGLAGLIFLRGNEDAWICENGVWVKHGNPSSAMPTQSCPSTTTEQDVILDSPKENDIATTPLLVKGKAKGSWFFEAEFPVKLFDEAGDLLAVSIARSKGEWMTENFVDFETEASFLVSTKTNAILVLEKNNPSDIRENDKKIEMPVVLMPSEKFKVQVFFNNNNLDPEISCNKVFPAEREIYKTLAVAEAALTELLKGPNQAEKNQGYSSNIPEGVKIQDLSINNGIAKVDFNQALQEMVGGSCRVSAIRAEITQTLLQFPSVREVVISINGQIEDILQP